MKVAIVGAGSVGTAIAYATMIQGLADEIAIYDLNGSKAVAEVLDLRHGVQFVRPVDLTGGDDLALCDAADVIVVTAGAKQDPGQTRLDLAHANAAITRSLVPQLLEHSPDTLLLFVTNPVDVVTYIGQQVAASHGVDHLRVFGSGTVLDTSRLRHLLAERLDVAESSVHASIMGEHGDSEIALWSSANVGGAPLGLPDDELDQILHDVRNAAYRIIEGKGATNLAIGLATARILRAIEGDEHSVLPVSARHDVAGVGEICFSLPTVVGRRGVIRTLDIPMSESERAGLLQSARAIRESIDAAG